MVTCLPPPNLRTGAIAPTAVLARIVGAVLLLWTCTLLVPSVTSAAGPTFERSVYGTATVTDTGGFTDIRVTSGAGGLRLRTVLDPAKTYRLAMDGRSEAGPINMRLSFDGRLDYRVTQARDFVRISGTSDFEVLLYSDTPAAYQLATTELEECSGACGTQADLKALVLEQTPGLAAALAAADQPLASDLLLEWAAARIPMGSVALDTGWLSAAELYFDYFRPLERGVDCGGAADFLLKLLALFDIPSFTVDFGTRVDALTHVVVVVADNRPGAVRWRIVDPTFAMTFRLPGAPGPVSLDQVLEADRVGLSGQIEPTLGDLSDRTVVLVQGAGEDPQRLRCQDADHRFSVCSLAGYGRSFDHLLVRNGFSTGLPGSLELFRRGELYRVGWHGVPADFIAMQERFRSAASVHDTTTVLAELPLRPVLRQPAQLSEPSLERDELTLSELDWHPRAPAEAVAIGWERCSADGGACQAVGVVGPNYRPVAEDVGSRLRAVITATNAHGQAKASSPLSDVVRALPAPQPTPGVPSEDAAPGPGLPSGDAPSHGIPPGDAAPGPGLPSGDAPSHGIPSGNAARDALPQESRLLPSRLSARTIRARAARGGLRYTTTGRLTLPRRSRGGACRGGSVSVQVKRGATVISLRTVLLGADCAYGSTVIFRDHARLGHGRLRVSARFTGTDLLRPRSAGARLVPAFLD